MKMNTFFMLIFVLIQSLAINLAHAAEYEKCEGNTGVQGKLFALYKSKKHKGGKCWAHIKNNTKIDAEDLSEQGESYQFSYVFPEQHEGKYDALFSVLVKELKEEGDVSDPYIEILREKMFTLCRRKNGTPVKSQLWGEFQAEFPGHKYNKFHNSGSVTRGRLAEFHVAFLNAERQCDRTDDEESGRRKTFYIEDVKFPDVPEIRIVANLLRLLQRDTALAFIKDAKYKKYRVRLKKAGVSTTGMLSTNFFISATEKSDVRIQDLSQRKFGQRLLLRPLEFEIR